MPTLPDRTEARDLAEHSVIYLFVDGIGERLRPGQRREAVLAAWGIGEDEAQGPAGADGGLQGVRRDGASVLSGPARPRARRSAAGGQRRGAGDHPGDRGCFPRSAHQRCLAHRMRNLAAKVPTDLWPEFKARVSACYQAPSRAIARQLAAGIRTDYADLLPSALGSFEDDLEARIAHLRLPVTHRRFIRTTNLLERLFVEERRRLKIIPNGFGEKPVLKLMFGALIRAADRWRGLRFTGFELRQIAAVRKELNQEYEASIMPLARSSQPQVSSKSAP